MTPYREKLHFNNCADYSAEVEKILITHLEQIQIAPSELFELRQSLIAFVKLQVGLEIKKRRILTSHIQNAAMGTQELKCGFDGRNNIWLETQINPRPLTYSPVSHTLDQATYTPTEYVEAKQYINGSIVCTLILEKS